MTTDRRCTAANPVSMLQIPMANKNSPRTDVYEFKLHQTRNQSLLLRLHVSIIMLRNPQIGKLNSSYNDKESLTGVIRMVKVILTTLASQSFPVIKK